MIKLRPYQTDGVEKIRAEYRAGKRAVLYVAPTGSGKTVLFAYVTHGAQNLNKRVLLLAHRVELIDQISRALTEQGVRHGIIAAGYEYRRGHSVYVASVFTLIKRLDLFVPDLLVFDEAHHCAGTTIWAKIIQAYQEAYILGVTATPCRLSGHGLSPPFQSLVLGPSPQDLIDIGALSPLRVFAPPTINTANLHKRMGDFVRGELIAAVDTPSITGDVVEHYKRLADGKQAVAFCVSIEHSQHVAERFRSAGYEAESVDGKLSRDVRSGIIGAFSRGKIKILTSCDLISEGFDCPRIEVGISLRPTHSLGLWLQQCGRILRPFPGKTEALLLDHAANTLKHGLPTEPRTWSLVGVQGGSGRSDAAGGVRVCSKCFSAQGNRKPRCTNCGEPFPVESRKVEQKKGTLEEMTPEQLAAYRLAREQGKTKDLDALIKLGQMRGYSDPEGWARHVWNARELKKKRA